MPLAHRRRTKLGVEHEEGLGRSSNALRSQQLKAVVWVQTQDAHCIVKRAHCQETSTLAALQAQAPSPPSSLLHGQTTRTEAETHFLAWRRHTSTAPTWCLASLVASAVTMRTDGSHQPLEVLCSTSHTRLTYNDAGLQTLEGQPGAWLWGRRAPLGQAACRGKRFRRRAPSCPLLPAGPSSPAQSTRSPPRSAPAPPARRHTLRQVSPT